MANVARLCLFSLLLIFTVMCFGRDMPKGDQNSLHDIEDYGGTGPNPKHNPKNPPPLEHLKMQINVDDYGRTGPNPKHDPHPHPPPMSNLDFHPKKQINVDDYGTGPNPKHDHHPPMSEELS